MKLKKTPTVIIIIFLIALVINYLEKSGFIDLQEEYATSDIKDNSQKTLDKAIKKGRKFSYVYNRDDWKPWIDIDNNCMNMRHEILQDQAKTGSVKYSSDGCYVKGGVWHDPFSGKILKRASDLDIDHIIPLKWAHDHGGSNWSLRIKKQFANDAVNLLAVDDGLNQQKSAKGPDEWMPPNISFHCEYLFRWKEVLQKYKDLKMKKHEKTYYEQKLKFCAV